MNTSSNPFSLLALVAASPFLIPAILSGETVAPYVADEDTLHLWHFDEDEPGPVSPADGVPGSFDLVPDGGKSGTPATLGLPGFEGFGQAGDTTAGSGAGFKGDSVAATDLTGPDGAFTFEALVRIPNITDRQMIISAEGNPLGERPFQFRIASGSIVLINIAGSGGNQGFPIPDTGPDAFVPDEWFHVAATYNGDETSAEDNFKMYWTRVEPGRTAANEIGSSVMAADLTGVSPAFGVGNDYRTVGSGNASPLGGQIDEVRISRITREPDDMIFGNQGQAAGLEITTIDFSPGSGLLELTWRKSGSGFYDVAYSRDLSDWSADLEAGLADGDDEKPADSDHVTITFDLNAVSLSGEERLFFRVAEAE